MAFVLKDVETKPIEGQKTGTSGLRKKTKVFMSEHYLANWVQSLFYSLENLEGGCGLRGFEEALSSGEFGTKLEE